MSYAFYSKLALSAFYITVFAVFWYGYKRRGWAFEDVVGMAVFMLLVLLVTLITEVTYNG